MGPLEDARWERNVVAAGVGFFAKLQKSEKKRYEASRLEARCDVECLLCYEEEVEASVVTTGMMDFRCDAILEQSFQVGWTNKEEHSTRSTLPRKIEDAAARSDLDTAELDSQK